MMTKLASALKEDGGSGGTGLAARTAPPPADWIQPEFLARRPAECFLLRSSTQYRFAQSGNVGVSIQEGVGEGGTRAKGAVA